MDPCPALSVNMFLIWGNLGFFISFMLRKKTSQNKCVGRDFQGFHDLMFPRVTFKVDYTSGWSKHMTDRQLINITNCLENTITFAAREGWIQSKAPCCEQLLCR